MAKWCPAIAAGLLLSACGDGGSTTPESAQSVSQASLTGPLRGYLAIEERAGKRVFDAWFSRAEEQVFEGLALWQEGAERCVDLEGQMSASDASQTRVGSRWQETLFAGEAIRIESRGGDVVTLQAQRYDSAVVYATTERWLDEPLPDDSQLTVTGSDEFPTMGPVGLAPLTPLVSSSPSGGFSTDVSEAVVWELSDDTSDNIELRIFATADGSTTPITSIKCWLNDSGQFVMPESVAQQLPENPQLVYSLVRTRDVTHEANDAWLHISQSSYP